MCIDNYAPTTTYHPISWGFMAITMWIHRAAGCCGWSPEWVLNRHISQEEKVEKPKESGCARRWTAQSHSVSWVQYHPQAFSVEKQGFHTIYQHNLHIYALSQEFHSEFLLKIGCHSARGCWELGWVNIFNNRPLGGEDLSGGQQGFPPKSSSLPTHMAVGRGNSSHPNTDFLSISGCSQGVQGSLTNGRIVDDDCGYNLWVGTLTNNPISMAG